MTKTQIWSTAFLALFIGLFFLNSLTKDLYNNDSSTEPGYKEPGNVMQQSSELSPAEMVSNWGCQTCHGQDLKGTVMAPTLHNLAQNYDRDRLINYLRNPNSFMDQDRFKEFKEKYRNIVMPAYNNKDVKELGKVADYLLGLE